jgi:DNA-binding transcriptional LysR family regulator
MPWNDRIKRRLKLRDLDILMAVIETGSMGKAGRRLNISQPAVSKAIVELEDALGVRLMDRSRRGIVPTPYGRALAKRSTAIFNDLRQGVQEIDFLTDPTKGEVRIGTTEPVAVAIVAPTIERLSRKYPKISFHVITGGNAALYRDVAERNIEFAICRIIGRLPDELDSEVLCYDAFSIATSARNPLTRRRKLAFADLVKEPWTVFPFDTVFGSVIAEAFHANGYEPPRLTVASPSLCVQNEMMATGRFITVLPGFMLRTTAARHLQLKALPVALPNAPMPVGLITLKNRTSTPLAQVFIDNVRAYAKPLGNSSGPHPWQQN